MRGKSKFDFLITYLFSYSDWRYYLCICIFMYNLYLLLGSGFTNMIIKTNYIEFSLVTYMYIFL